MEETKHTPGPWKVRYMRGEDDPEAGFFVEAKHTHPDAAYGIDILCDGDAYYPWQQRLADAKLIAQAPDLLAKVSEQEKEIDRLREERKTSVYIELGKLWNLLLKQGYGNDLNILATFHKFREQFNPEVPNQS